MNIGANRPRFLTLSLDRLRQVTRATVSLCRTQPSFALGFIGLWWTPWLLLAKAIEAPAFGLLALGVVVLVLSALALRVQRAKMCVVRGNAVAVAVVYVNGEFASYITAAEHAEMESQVLLDLLVHGKQLLQSLRELLLHAASLLTTAAGVLASLMVCAIAWEPYWGGVALRALLDAQQGDPGPWAQLIVLVMLVLVSIVGLRLALFPNTPQLSFKAFASAYEARVRSHPCLDLRLNRWSRLDFDFFLPEQRDDRP